MAWSGYNSFERVAPGTGPQGAATGIILERLAQSRLAANLPAGTAIGASMLAIGVVGMPGLPVEIPTPETIAPIIAADPEVTVDVITMIVDWIKGIVLP